MWLCGWAKECMERQARPCVTQRGRAWIVGASESVSAAARTRGVQDAALKQVARVQAKALTLLVPGCMMRLMGDAQRGGRAGARHDVRR